MDTNDNVGLLVLQSKKIFSSMLELNCNNNTYREFRRVPNDGEFSKINLNGVFDFLGQTLVALYVVAGGIFLKIADKVIAIDESIEIVVSGEKNNRRLQVIKNGNTISTLSYATSEASTFENDPTAFVDNEDYDFGLFVANVLSSFERRKVILENW